MKTYHIKDLLKKDLLIVELPENGYYEVFKHGIYFKDYLNADRGFIEGSYTLLGSPDEIKEEDAEELVEAFDLSYYVDYNHPTRGAYTLSATESLLSALEKEILWENPYGKEPIEKLQLTYFKAKLKGSMENDTDLRYYKKL